MKPKPDNGKGSEYRPVDVKKYEDGWDRIWGGSDESTVDEVNNGEEEYDKDKESI